MPQEPNDAFNSIYQSRRKKGVGAVVFASVALHGVILLALHFMPPQPLPEKERLVEVDLQAPPEPTPAPPKPEVPEPRPTAPPVPAAAPQIPRIPEFKRPTPPRIAREIPRPAPVLSIPKFVPPPLPVVKPRPVEKVKETPPRREPERQTPVASPKPEPKTVQQPQRVRPEETTREQFARAPVSPRTSSNRAPRSTPEEAGTSGSPSPASPASKRPRFSARPDAPNTGSNKQPQTDEASQPVGPGANTPPRSVRNPATTPTDDNFGGGRRGAAAGMAPSGGGIRNGRNDELAGSDSQAGGAAPRRTARRGGGSGIDAGVFAMNSPSGERLATAPSNTGPTAGPGVGTSRGRGIGTSDTGFDDGALRSGAGPGLGAGKRGGVNGPSGAGGGRGSRTPGGNRGGETAGDGGTGGGSGGGSGNGRGTGRRGGPRPRLAGDPFGGSGGGRGGNGNGDGNSGNGTGPAGPGGSGRIARRGAGGGTGGGDGAGNGDASGLGRGGSGAGGDGFGRGNGSGTGSRGRGAGRSEQAGGGNDNAGRGKIGSGTRLQREREAEQLIGRGLYPSGITGSYYQDADQTERGLGPGDPIDWPTFTRFKFKRVDKTIDFDWGAESPGGGMTGVYWSVRWTGKIFVPKDDDYRFFFENVDDGVRLYLDGERIIDIWKVQKSTPASKIQKLKRGAHDVVIEYVQGPAVESSIKLQWESSSFKRETIGAYQSGGTR